MAQDTIVTEPPVADSAVPASPPASLLGTLDTLIARHRPAVQQARTFQRLRTLTFGHLLAFGRHTITQSLIALGLHTVDWSGAYRLFSTPRVAEADLAHHLTQAALDLVPETGPVVAVVDGVQIARHSRRMPGTSWFKHPGTPAFRAGIHRAQRFVDLALLTPVTTNGYSRALPLRWLPAAPAKAVAVTGQPARTEVAAALDGIGWLRAELDQADRTTQPLLVVGDGLYSATEMWAGLPGRVRLLARCPRNRALFAFPVDPAPGARRRGRRRLYGEQAKAPHDWLQEQAGWSQTEVGVRGRTIPLTYRVEGPYRLKRAAGHPVWLLVVRGVAGDARRKRRQPGFWLVSAVADDDGTWQLPLPATDLLALAWQRWEVEVTHRECKTDFGVGEVQCWNEHSAYGAIQWQVWVYSLLVLAGLLTWGLAPGPVTPLGGWRTSANRWSLGRLHEGIRRELWQAGEFQPVWLRTTGTWTEMADWMAARTNLVLGTRR